MFIAKVYISLKPSVNDPQGLTIRSGLHQLGFDSVLDVRAGKYMEIRVNEREETAAREHVSEMCRQLLANPIIEDFRFDLEPDIYPVIVPLVLGTCPALRGSYSSAALRDLARLLKIASALW